MPPEVLAGQRADARSDQFSFSRRALRVPLREQAPFEPRARPERQQARGVSAQRRAQARDSRLPSRLRRALLARPASARPEDRFPDMDALLGALSAIRCVARLRSSPPALGLCLVVGALAGAQPHGGAQARRARDADACLSPVWNESRREARPPRVRGHEAALRGRGVAHERAAALRRMPRAGPRCAPRRARRRACAASSPRRRWACGWPAWTGRRARCRPRRGHAGDRRRQGRGERPGRRRDLPPLAMCADVEALRRPQRPPEAPARRARLDDLRSSLVRAQALLSVGKPALARDQATPLVAAPASSRIDRSRRRCSSCSATRSQTPETTRRPCEALQDAAIAAEVGRELRARGHRVPSTRDGRGPGPAPVRPGRALLFPRPRVPRAGRARRRDSRRS